MLMSGLLSILPPTPSLTSPPLARALQVMRDYCKYADAFIGHWRVDDSGYRDPCVRSLFRPMLNLFHGERGSKKWKSTVDEVLKQDPGTLSEVRVVGLVGLVGLVGRCSFESCCARLPAGGVGSCLRCGDCLAR